MRVLLLGEFSSVHYNLASGLKHYGIEVVTASSGDTWKKISSDISWSSKSHGALGKFEKLAKLGCVAKKFSGFDVVQLVSPIVFPTSFGINRKLVSHIINENERTFLLGAGGTLENHILYNYYRDQYRYKKLFDSIRSDSSLNEKTLLANLEYSDWLHTKISGYIPIMHEYAEPYRNVNYDRLRRTIPIPIDLDAIKYKDNLIKGKVNFYHGVTRRAQKGTPIIEEALRLMKSKYPNDIEFHVVGGLPLKDYLDITSRSNAIIDQVYSLSYGMNTAYNLALGKVCIGGGHSEMLKEFNLKQSPLLPIEPDVNSICMQIEWVLQNKNKMLELGLASREYAEQLHCNKRVAQAYIKEWGIQ